MPCPALRDVPAPGEVDGTGADAIGAGRRDADVGEPPVDVREAPETLPSVPRTMTGNVSSALSVTRRGGPEARHVRPVPQAGCGRAERDVADRVRDGARVQDVAAADGVDGERRPAVERRAAQGRGRPGGPLQRREPGRRPRCRARRRRCPASRRFAACRSGSSGERRVEPVLRCPRTERRGVQAPVRVGGVRDRDACHPGRRLRGWTARRRCGPFRPRRPRSTGCGPRRPVAPGVAARDHPGSRRRSWRSRAGRGRPRWSPKARCRWPAASRAIAGDASPVSSAMRVVVQAPGLPVDDADRRIRERRAVGGEGLRVRDRRGPVGGDGEAHRPIGRWSVSRSSVQWPPASVPYQTPGCSPVRPTATCRTPAASTPKAGWPQL